MTAGVRSLSIAAVWRRWRGGRATPGLRGNPPDNLRARFARHLHGVGIEVGALANPLWVPPEASVLYVDKFDYDALCAHYRDAPVDQIRRPDIVSDTISLDRLPDHAYDFLIACHLLEHAHDPIRALLAWHRVLRPGGLALCIVPDARYTFDRGRPLTSLDHLLWDFASTGTEMKRLADLGHIAECNLNMHESLDAQAALELARRILDESYDTHFHVWTHDSLRVQLESLIADYGLPFVLLESACDEQVEMLFLLEAAPLDPARFRLVDGVAQRATR
jgi:SAM-dependent methyltransferase